MRARDALRAERGLLRDDDFLALLQRYARSDPATPAGAIHYENGRLTLEFAGAGTEAASGPDLGSLRAAGLAAEAMPGEPGRLRLLPAISP
jgi:hypothetical protein